MAFVDDAKDLERSFVATRTLLQELLSALEQRRTAWVSVRPEVLAPSTDIEQLSHKLAAQENLRAGLLKRIRQELPTPNGQSSDKLHINVTRIAGYLPREQGRSLRDAADAVQPLAKMVRAETTLGQRLLRFAKSTEIRFDGAVQGASPNASAPGYDRLARTIDDPRRAGHLVDGRA